jgi:hypothetical protein
LLGRGATASFLALLHLLGKVFAYVVYEVEVEEILLGFNAFDDFRKLIDLIIDSLVLAWVHALERLRLIHTFHVWLLFARLVFVFNTLLVFVAGQFLRRVLHHFVSLFIRLLIEHLLHRLNGLFVHFRRIRLDLNLLFITSI